MRLDFNILWVEDQPNEVKAQRDRIGHLLRKEGFRVNAEFATSVSDAEKFLRNDIYGDHIDLVLMDFDLGDGPNGGVGIEKVRDQFPFKDIVFYSASGLGRMQEALTAVRFQGIFCSTRLDLPNVVEGVFLALVKKVLDIDHSRGVVMGASCEIDSFVNESLSHMFSNGDEVQIKTALIIVAQQLKEIRKSFASDAQKIESAVAVSELLALHQIYTSAHRLRLLRKALEAKGTHATEVEKMKAYAKDTIPLRNDLAHVTVTRNGFSRKIYNREKKELTMDDMRALRVALLDHHEMFEKTAASLKPPAPLPQAS